MLSEDFLKYLDGLITELRSTEIEQKRVYDEAINIVDTSRFNAVTSKTHSNIQQIRKWIENLQNIRNEMHLAAFISKHPETTVLPPLEELEQSVEINSENETKPDFPSNGLFDEPSIITLFNKSYPVKHWSDVLVTVCEVMLLKNPYIVAKFDKLDALNVGIQTGFSFEKDDIRYKPKRLSNGLYIETDVSAETIRSICQQILTVCGYDPNEPYLKLTEVC